jgi:cobalt-zinc-cadmium efflux system protein
VVITATETVGGLLSGSLALLSDAGHNLSDVLALALALVGSWGASRRPTIKATYGLGRLEVATALINALSLVAIALFILYEAFQRYASPTAIHVPIMLIVATVGLIGNLLSVFILHGDHKHNINNRAAFLHMLYDAISSVAVIIGGIVILFTGWVLVDLILSVLIAMMILWSSLDIIKEASGIFMEQVPRGIDVEQVAETISRVPGVHNVHHLHIWTISSRAVALSCHITLAEADSPRFAVIIRAINETLLAEYGISHATIQPEGDLCPEQTLVYPTPRTRRDKQ